jgi:hypothetical protein
MVNKMKSEQPARSMSSDGGMPGKTPPDLASSIDTLSTRDGGSAPATVTGAKNFYVKTQGDE